MLGTQLDHAARTPAHASSTATARQFVIGLIAFLTVVDLFATQALLPTLAKTYGVSPAAMGTAVNASTIGMGVAGLVVAYFSRRIDRRRGIVLSLGLLSVRPLCWPSRRISRHSPHCGSSKACACRRRSR